VVQEAPRQAASSSKFKERVVERLPYLQPSRQVPKAA
jgi:hypothetical protein